MKAEVFLKQFLGPLQKDGEICPTLKSSLSEVGKEQTLKQNKKIGGIFYQLFGYI